MSDDLKPLSPALATVEQPAQEQTAPCPLCQHPLTFTIPQGAPFRHPQGTILFFPHPQPIRCSECGQHYTPFLIGAQGIAWNWQPCPPPAEGSRILPVTRPLGPIPFKRRPQ